MWTLLLSGKARGALIKIGTSVRAIHSRARIFDEEERYNKYQNETEVALAHKHPTSLKALSESEFDSLARHGFECTDATLNAYKNDLVGKKTPVG